MCIKMKCIIPDTSAVIIGAVSDIAKDLDYPEIIVPEAVVCELEHQANANRSEGHEGLKELQKLQKLQDEGELAVTFKGKRPTNYDIRYAKSGEIDSIIRDLARSEMGTLLTNDKIQAEVAKSQGIPVKYYELPFKDKDLVAKLIGKINWHFRDMDKHMMLIVPGRVGTTSPELGVPTSFADISAYDIICETEESRAGYNPELSYGSHIFQDLVEAEILYTAIFQGEKTKHYSPEKLESSKDLIGELEFSDVLEGVVHVYDVSDRKCEIYNDVAGEHLLITC